jgi:G2/mitotic-specific cyclin 3/4
VPSKQILHQRHKSTGTLSTMLGAGGLKMAVKRTAFGDVSNTAKTIIAAHDDLETVGKNINYEVVEKPSAPQEKSAAFLRPAQRPLAGLKSFLASNSLVNTSAAPSLPAKASIAEAEQPLVKSRTLSKRTTTIYKDSTALELDQSSQPAAQPAIIANAPVAPVHQSLGPRQHKSQPQLQVDQAPLRRTQSKIIEKSVDVSQEELVATGTDHQEVPEQRSNQFEERKEKATEDIRRENQQAEELAIQMREEINRQERQLPALPLLSEPEEYWEEEEEELYDEQGYTTAHSYRSRGDNTTGGATTVLFPKVTNKVKKELAIAKDIVENSRTAEEIEDEAWDTSMVAEYGDEIFQYMRELEVCLFLFHSSISAYQAVRRIVKFRLSRPLNYLCLHLTPSHS